VPQNAAPKDPPQDVVWHAVCMQHPPTMPRHAVCIPEPFPCNRESFLDVHCVADTIPTCPLFDPLPNGVFSMLSILRPNVVSDLPTVSDLTGAVRKILSTNAKLEKTPTGEVIINSGIAFAPAARGGVGNVCEHATPGCIAACVLWFAGRTVSKSVRNAAIARTRLWAIAPAEFYRRLGRELRNQERRARKAGARSYCRPDVASDVGHTHLAAEHSETTFYGYSKNVSRVLAALRGEFGPNYHLSYSLNERSTVADVSAILEAGGNIVVVADSYYWGPTRRYGPIPAAVEFVGPSGERITVSTVDGDIHDIRTPEYDGRGVAVVLRLKGGTKSKLRAIQTGFARPFEFGGKEHSARFVRPDPIGTMTCALL